ncbi:rhodopsin, GQ-coupled-like [Lycorma delicatula]|uniref:rhodopsin, GQ-coupled-like n=1 Tax=Lycorma delicatula TaxID=130591 RepID=UPI003F517601
MSDIRNTESDGGSHLAHVNGELQLEDESSHDFPFNADESGQPMRGIGTTQDFDLGSSYLAAAVNMESGRVVDLSPLSWSGYPKVSWEVHYFMGSILALVGVAGIVGNIIVLFVFTRFRRLRGPFSCFIVNLALADLTTSVLHIMAVYSCFNKRWAFGKIGCMIYAAGVGHFGLLSIVTLSAIAVERFMVITAKPLSGQWKITERGARQVCVFAWWYCFSLSLPPLFGWSRYIPEGFFTSCSWDYTTRTTANRAYYIYLLTFGFLIPVTIITYCYVFILTAIFEHGKEMSAIKAIKGGRQPLTSSLPTAPASSTIRTAEIILTLVLLFLLSWTPYAVVTLIGQFGNQGLVTPWVSALPAFFAKASVVYNPIVYGLSHPHFRASLRQYLAGGSPESIARVPSSLRMTNNRHQAHFRCFPLRQGSTKHYHSEPEQRQVTIVI